jgi:Dihydrodipicolinate synthase/N-acetylneuraminate lyase
MVTPFRPDGSLDVDAFQWLAKRLVSAGVDGLFPNSTTGEFVHLTAEEAERLVRTAVAVAPAEVMVLPGVSSNRTEDSVRMARSFVNLGADGVVVLPPFFFRGGEEVMYRHLSEVAKAVDVPVVIYNNPINTGVVVPVSVYVRLAQEFSNVSAAKVTYADFSYLLELIREVKAVRKDFSVSRASTTWSWQPLSWEGTAWSAPWLTWPQRSWWASTGPGTPATWPRPSGITGSSSSSAGSTGTRGLASSPQQLSRGPSRAWGPQ